MKRKKTPAPLAPEIIDVDSRQFDSLLARLEDGQPETDDHVAVRQLAQAYKQLIALIGDKQTRIARLRKMLFGASTELAEYVLGDEASTDAQAAASTGDAPANDRAMTPQEIVFDANDRCDQENLIQQQKAGVYALKAPLDNLHSNWAYMVMASLAWSLKAWSALLLPVVPRWQERHGEEKRRLLRMDFATYRQAWINVPAQIARTGRKIVYRLLAWNPWQAAFFRLFDRLRAAAHW